MLPACSTVTRSMITRETSKFYLFQVVDNKEVDMLSNLV